MINLKGRGGVIPRPLGWPKTMGGIPTMAVNEIVRIIGSAVDQWVSCSHRRIVCEERGHQKVWRESRGSRKNIRCCIPTASNLTSAHGRYPTVCGRTVHFIFFAHREHKKMHWRHFLAILLLSGCTTGRAIETVEPIQPARPAVLGMNGILQPDRIIAGGSESCPFFRA